MSGTFVKQNSCRAVLSLMLLFYGGAFHSPVMPHPPELTSLKQSNPELKKLRAEIASNLKSTARNRTLAVPLRMVSYRVRPNENFYTIMAKVSQDADTLASLNRLPAAAALRAGDTMMIPNARGLFILKEDAGEHEKRSGILVNNSSYFLAGERYSQEEKRYFNGEGFLRPVDGGRTSSDYGMRRDPFTNKLAFHGGIDIAAPLGSKVYASRDGIVEFSGVMGGYGNLIILSHEFGYRTYYGHLQSIRVKKGERVKKGAWIGKVGVTGLTTGPHLHFEVRKYGKRERPQFRDEHR